MCDFCLKYIINFSLKCNIFRTYYYIKFVKNQTIDQLIELLVLEWFKGLFAFYMYNPWIFGELYHLRDNGSPKENKDFCSFCMPLP